MRAYIRHPADVPIEFSPITEQLAEKNLTQDVSMGGLSFSSSKRLTVGTRVKIKIPLVEPTFEAEANVIWCLARPDRFEAGIEFINKDDAFTARMVEQVCHIEHYRMWVKEVEGRSLDGEEAAAEWISKYASDFPKI